ncbi:cellulase family glycosylhydrolase [Patescibacteria group bacterium]|nr:cellulase family glycosylhydrolase [Patescibacteria group bacterium]
MNFTKLRNIGIVVAVLPILIFVGVKVFVNVPQLSGSVLGANTQLINVGVNFSQKTSDSSPLLFGGVHAPEPADKFVWDTVSDIGVNLLRSDFFIEYCGPKNITIADYKQNVNEIQDTRNWTKSCLSTVSQIYSNAKKRNMKVTAVVAYTPPWLTKSGQPKDLPMDWEVYEDLVMKMYKLNREYIDYVEVWNEPDHPNFLQTGNKDKEADYLLLYQHISKAIKRVDDEANDGKRALIGGPAISCTCHLSFVERLLQDPATRGNIDFVSVHSYGENDQNLPKVRQLMKKYGYGDLPLYVSEWNKTSIANNDRPYNQTYLAVGYTTGRLIEFLNNDVDMAAYFSLRPNDPSNSLPERQAYGFYRKEGAKYRIFPQQWVWQLLSKNLQLGQVPSEIFKSETTNPEPSAVLGFGNASVKGVVVNNPGSNSTVNFTGYKLGERGQRYIVEVSKITEKGLQSGFCVQRITLDSTDAKFKFEAPAKSVVAVEIKKSDSSLAELSKILAPTTQNNCLSFEE